MADTHVPVRHKVYRVVDWVSRYEVTMKNRPADGEIPMECRRKGPLLYVRSKVHGLSTGQGIDDLFEMAWRPGELFHWAVFGIFHKLLEIAADQKRDRRGWLLDGNGEPITPASFAKRFRDYNNEKLIAEAFDIMVRNKWLEIHELAIVPGKFRESPEIPGCLYKTKQDKTETETTQDENPAAERQKRALYAAEELSKGSRL